MDDGRADAGDVGVGTDEEGASGGHPAALRHGTVWRRWTDGGVDLHLHRACEVVPRVERLEEWPYVRVGEARGDPPTFTPLRDGADEAATDEDVKFRFLTGVPRQLLGHVPLVVLLATVLLFGGAELTAEVGGVSDLVPVVDGTNALLFGVFLATLPAMFWLLSRGEVLGHHDAIKALVVYGLAAFLGVSVALSIVLVLLADHPGEVDPNVVVTAGYLLVLLVGGLLLYEGTLRLEHMLVSLPDQHGDVVDDERAYRRFLTRLHHDLTGRSVLGVHPSRLFGVVLAAQFAIFWLIGSGPQNLGYVPGLVVNFALNAVLATVVFQFFVLVRHVHGLFGPVDRYGGRALLYQPFHIDGHGGFRDFGKFATRINVILTFGGLYVVYRVYVVGGRGLPTGGVAAFEDPILLTVWFVSFAGPVVAYALGAGAWGYYTFWSMHAKMVRDKYELAWRYQGTDHATEVDRAPSAGDRIRSFDAAGGPEWGALRSAPTWPLDVNIMLSLASGNVIPLLIPVASVLGIV